VTWWSVCCSPCTCCPKHCRKIGS